MYSSDYAGEEFANVKAEKVIKALEFDLAALRVACVRVLEAGGSALHANFQAGDEPKWKDDSQRESLLQLSNALSDLHEIVTGE